MSLFSDFLSNVKTEVIEAGQNSINKATTEAAAKINTLFGVPPLAPVAAIDNGVKAVPTAGLLQKETPAPAAPSSPSTSTRNILYAVGAVILLIFFLRK